MTAIDGSERKAFRTAIKNRFTELKNELGEKPVNQENTNTEKQESLIRENMAAYGRYREGCS